MAALYGIFTTANLIGFVIMFFVVAILGKLMNDFGIGFKKIVAWVSLIGYFVLDVFLPLKWAIFLGFIGAMLAGFLAGGLMGGDEDGD